VGWLVAAGLDQRAAVVTRAADDYVWVPEHVAAQDEEDRDLFAKAYAFAALAEHGPKGTVDLAWEFFDRILARRLEAAAEREAEAERLNAAAGAPAAPPPETDPATRGEACEVPRGFADGG
jgi:hypothetical protein